MSTSPRFHRDTVQRRAIREALKAAGRPLGPEEILGAAQAAAPKLGLATVYRTLKTLVAGGEAAVVELPGAAPRYEAAASGRHHHHHFRCTACDRVYELEGCVSALRALVPPGFKLTSHELLLEGRCESCAR